ncbi:sodium/calcium exchanger regulatory protein 1-like isoform X2 [Biomphalaria glabrata]|nr:sodium/calcium exchanger regulatory protein 1-like isoform X2 [Biomphalaria glabrata]
MAQFCGKWELVSCDENFDKYMEAVGVSPEMRKLAQTALTAGSKLVLNISVDGNKWSIGLLTKEGEKTDVFIEGEPVEVTTLDGRKVKTTYTLEGDSLVELQQGDGFESRNVRTVNGDTMTMILTTKSVTCTRIYKKIS